MNTKNTPIVQFQDLLNNPYHYNGEIIIIRGFLYHISDEISILSAEPNLKSCCIGSDSKRLQQVIVYGDDLPTQNNLAVTLSGSLFSEKSHYGYRLSDAKTVKDNTHQWPIATLFILFISFISMIILFKCCQNNRIKRSS